MKTISASTAAAMIAWARKQSNAVWDSLSVSGLVRGASCLHYDERGTISCTDQALRAYQEELYSG